MWVESEGCEKIITNAWKDSTTSNDFDTLMNITESCSQLLTTWNHKVIGQIQTNINQARSLLQQLQANDPTALEWKNNRKLKPFYNVGLREKR